MSAATAARTRTLPAQALKARSRHRRGRRAQATIDAYIHPARNLDMWLTANGFGEDLTSVDTAPLNRYFRDYHDRHGQGRHSHICNGISCERDSPSPGRSLNVRLCTAARLRTSATDSSVADDAALGGDTKVMRPPWPPRAYERVCDSCGYRWQVPRQFARRRISGIIFAGRKVSVGRFPGTSGRTNFDYELDRAREPVTQWETFRCCPRCGAQDYMQRRAR